MRSCLPVFFASIWMQSLLAAELTVHVADQRGRVVADAIVTLTPRAGTELPAALQHPARTLTIDQKNETFIPYVEVFRPGDRVVFRNSDRTRHHVYSFATAAQFEFMLAPGESSQPLQLDRTGVIATGCNIHDQMITYLFVTDAAVFARSDDSGRAHIASLPSGSFDVRVWQPLLRPGRDNVQTLTNVGGDTDKSLDFSLTLLPDPRAKIDRERVGY